MSITSVAARGWGGGHSSGPSPRPRRQAQGPKAFPGGVGDPQAVSRAPGELTCPLHRTES